MSKANELVIGKEECILIRLTKSFLSSNYKIKTIDVNWNKLPKKIDVCDCKSRYVDEFIRTTLIYPKSQKPKIELTFHNYSFGEAPRGFRISYILGQKLNEHEVSILTNIVNNFIHLVEKTTRKQNVCEDATVSIVEAFTYKPNKTVYGIFGIITVTVKPHDNPHHIEIQSIQGRQRKYLPEKFINSIPRNMYAFRILDESDNCPEENIFYRENSCKVSHTTSDGNRTDRVLFEQQIIHVVDFVEILSSLKQAAQRYKELLDSVNL